MPKTHTAPAHAIEPKTSKKSVDVTSALAPVPEFDADVHHEEIAQVAYRLWLERADGPGSPEQDWLQAVNEVRAKYTQ